MVLAHSLIIMVIYINYSLSLAARALLHRIRVGLGGVMATMNQSSEAAASGIGGWFQGLSYMAGLSGGAW